MLLQRVEVLAQVGVLGPHAIGLLGLCLSRSGSAHERPGPSVIACGPRTPTCARTSTCLQKHGQSLDAEGVKRLFADDLKDVPTLVIAAPGVDGDSLDKLTEALSDSASTFLGTVTVDDKVELQGGVAEDMAHPPWAPPPAIPPSCATSRPPSSHRQLNQASKPGTSGPEPPQTSLPPTENSVLGSLVYAGFLMGATAFVPVSYARERNGAGTTVTIAARGRRASPTSDRGVVGYRRAATSRGGPSRGGPATP